MQDAHRLLAQATQLFEREDFAGAERLYRQLLQIDPTNTDLHRILGVVARRQERFDEALALGRRAIELHARSDINHFELGVTYLKLQRELDALPCFERAAEINPQLQQAYVNASAILEHHDRIDAAARCAQRAVELAPDCPIARYNYGNVLRESGDLRGAIEQLRQSVALNPENPKPHWNLALCHLALGEYAAGWPEYEWRERAGEVFFDKCPQPRWHGGALTGQSILIHAEQGLGDEVLFASCFGEVVAQAARTTITCDPRLAPLFGRSFPQATIVPWQRRRDWLPAPLERPVDLQIPAGSLPLLLRRSRAEFPERARFLRADAAKVQAWRERLAAAGPGLKVGISWQAGGQPVERRKRSTPLALWRPLFQIPGVQFVNLQYGECEADLAAARAAGMEILHWNQSDPLLDLDDFAAQLSALDLVISVGNATVHLAGALGTPAWALLPLVPSWRWMSAGEENPWYASVRLFRQAVRGEWAPVFMQLARRLALLAGTEPPAAEPAPPTAAPAAPVRKTRRGLGFSEQGEVVRLQSAGPGAAPSSLAGPDEPPLAPLGAFQRTSGIDETYQQAAAAAQAGELPRAESLCREILQHTPRHYSALQLLGAIARNTGRSELAIRMFRRAVAIDAHDPLLHFQLAEALRDAGEETAAVHSYLAALDRRPDYPVALVHLGYALRKLNKPLEAMRCFLQALQLKPDFAEAYHAIGVVHLQDGKHAQAARMFRLALTIEPQNYGAAVNLGRACQAAGEVAEAAAAYARALELSPAEADQRCRLADALVQLGEQAAALAGYEQALAAQADYAPALAGRTRLAALQSAEGPAGNAPTAPLPASVVAPLAAPRTGFHGATLYVAPQEHAPLVGPAPHFMQQPGGDRIESIFPIAEPPCAGA